MVPQKPYEVVFDPVVRRCKVQDTARGMVCWYPKYGVVPMIEKFNDVWCIWHDDVDTRVPCEHFFEAQLALEHRRAKAARLGVWTWVPLGF